MSKARKSEVRVIIRGLPKQCSGGKRLDVLVVWLLNKYKMETTTFGRPLLVIRPTNYCTPTISQLDSINKTASLRNHPKFVVQLLAKL